MDYYEMDYYEILGVEKNATIEQIKEAFRTLALIYHPDKNPGDKEAEAKFVEINKAYEVLSDPETKTAYDTKIIQPYENQSNISSNTSDIEEDNIIFSIIVFIIVIFCLLYFKIPEMIMSGTIWIFSTIVSVIKWVFFETISAIYFFYHNILLYLLLGLGAIYLIFICICGHIYLFEEKYSKDKEGYSQERIAQNLYKRGMSITKISKVLGLSRKTIKKYIK